MARHTAESRRKVSEARRKQIEESPHVLPEEKFCAGCEKTKPAREFYIEYRVLSTGEKRPYLRSKCRICEQDRVKKIKQTDGKGREYQRRVDEKVRSDPERLARHRQYQREWSAAKRRREGAKAVGPWKRYRDTPRGDSVDVEPIHHFLRIYLTGATAPDLGSFAARSDVNERTLRRILDLDPEMKSVRMTIVDHILLAADAQEMLNELYPLD